MKRYLAVAMALAAVVGALAVAPGVQAGGRVCRGREATIVGGTGNNTKEGTPGRDVFSLGAGNDVAYGRGGDDIICLGTGSDDAFGQQGADQIDGGRGNDFRAKGEKGGGLHGGLGADRIWGRKGTDSLFGWRGPDLMYGGGGDDLLESYDDTNSNDYMNGGGEAEGDACVGDPGDDRVDCELNAP